MHRDIPAFTKLCLPYRQHAAFRVNIISVKMQRLTGAQPRGGVQAIQGQSGKPLAMRRARLKAIVAIELGTWRCIGARPARDEAGGYGRCFESSGGFFTRSEERRVGEE